MHIGISKRRSLQQRRASRDSALEMRSVCSVDESLFRIHRKSMADPGVDPANS